ncbi:hypothetical protein [Nisaea nitritireducens]|uniref:hypothetical protein n=1 Tax=Nisaea nitritireducens TaxID=568392 RepID=UPI00186964FD|nr:hypothetical protein [Nisaea nitritireducens]
MEKEQVIGQILAVLEKWNEIKPRFERGDGDIPTEIGVMIHSELANAIRKIAPVGTIYRDKVDKIILDDNYWSTKISDLAGILLAIKNEIECGYLDSIEESIHLETSASFMDMAQNLMSQGYKDAAAVIIGSVLEQHIRSLSAKNSIEVEVDGKFRKAEALNADLVKNRVINKLDQKNVTAWLGLRNEAAHGEYSSYGADQVRLMIASIQDFVTRYPA